MLVVALLLLTALFLAYANGANDIFKGVATLYGSRTLSYRPALALAVGSTVLGSALSLVLAQALVKAFSGKGLVPDEVLADPSFLGAVGLGAGGTVFLATLIGLPISTTHALTGALVGAGLVGAWGDLNLGVLGGTFALPLLLSPFLALAITAVLYPILRRIRLRMGVTRETCVCVQDEGGATRLVPIAEGAAAVAVVLPPVASGGARTLSVVVDDQTECVQRYAGTVAGVRAETVLNTAHVLSAGAVGFARGLNDTPKIAAILVAAPALGLPLGVALVGIVMALGGIVQARKVAETMSNEITGMNAGQGFTGNVVSAFLIVVASRLGVPVSTTHVTCGSLFGIGVSTGQARWKMIGGIFLAWVTTLPVAALLAAGVFFLLR